MVDYEGVANIVLMDRGDGNDQHQNRDDSEEASPGGAQQQVSSAEPSERHDQDGAATTSSSSSSSYHMDAVELRRRGAHTREAAGRSQAGSNFLRSFYARATGTSNIPRVQSNSHEPTVDQASTSIHDNVTTNTKEPEPTTVPSPPSPTSPKNDPGTNTSTDDTGGFFDCNICLDGATEPGIFIRVVFLNYMLDHHHVLLIKWSRCVDIYIGMNLALGYMHYVN